jgi:hypothetical protein
MKEYSNKFRPTNKQTVVKETIVVNPYLTRLVPQMKPVKPLAVKQFPKESKYMQKVYELQEQQFNDDLIKECVDEIKRNRKSSPR